MSYPMDKPGLIRFWQRFFTDLFLGTFIKLFLSSLCGFALGAAALYGFKMTMLAELDWQSWIKTAVLVLTFFWFAGFGVFHGLIFSVIHIVGKKFTEMVGGLHDLLDLFTREVIARIPRFSKNIPREELARKFDDIGREFQGKLRLKGITGWISSVLFGIILKALKFFFLDQVVEELSKNSAEQITSSHIEHAVRRVGVDIILEPIIDNLILLQILNGVLLILLLSVPFWIFWFI